MSCRNLSSSCILPNRFEVEDSLCVFPQVKILEKATYGMAATEDEQLVVVSQVFCFPNHMMADGLCSVQLHQSLQFRCKAAPADLSLFILRRTRASISHFNLIIIPQVLASDVNIGYEDIEATQVTSSCRYVMIT